MSASSTERTGQVPAARRRTGVLAALGGVLVVAALTVPAGLGHDVRYVLGVQRTSTAPVAETFAHRPLLYRWAMAALDAVGSAPGAGRVGTEVAVRAGGLLLCLAAGWVLWRGLRRVLPATTAAVAAAAITAATALAGPWTALQPEWLAVVVVLASVGAGLRWSAGWPGAVLAGTGLAAAAWLKVVTLPTSLLGLLVLALFARRLALRAAVVATAAGLAWAVVLWLAFPVEVRWLRELNTLNPASPLNRLPTGGDVEALGTALAQYALMVPVISLLPAVTVLLAARRAWPRLAVLVVAVGLAAAPLVLQGQWFLYHLAALGPVAAAVVVAAAVADGGRYARVLVSGAVATALWGGVCLSAPLDWRLAHGTVAFAGLAVLVLLVAAGLLAAARGGRPAGPVAGLLLAGAVAGATAVAALPTAGYSFDQRHADLTVLANWRVAGARAESAAAIRDVLGSETRTAYLAFGDVPYAVGVPTDCRYPSATWLQRAAGAPLVRDTESYRDNLACLREPVGHLVVQPGWFDLAAAPPEVRQLVEERFDCSRAAVFGDLAVCPAR